MEIVGVVSYKIDNDRDVIPPAVYSKITRKVDRWIRSVAPTVKDWKGCDINEKDIGIQLK